jgi:transcriptional regulator with XRE-family HTH domain
MDVTSNCGPEPTATSPEAVNGGPSHAQGVRDREELAWELRSKGYSQASIARVLGVSQPMVHKILKRVAARVLDVPEDQARLDLHELVLNCDLLFEMAIDGWTRSLEISRQDQLWCQPAEDGTLGPRPRMPDARFLRSAERAQEAKRGLLGFVGKESRREASGSGGRGPIPAPVAMECAEEEPLEWEAEAPAGGSEETEVAVPLVVAAPEREATATTTTLRVTEPPAPAPALAATSGAGTSRESLGDYPREAIMNKQMATLDAVMAWVATRQAAEAAKVGCTIGAAAGQVPEDDPRYHSVL